MPPKSREVYAFGAYRLDATGRMLFRNGRGVALPPKEIDTLIILVRAGGAVVDRESLVSQVWPDTFVEEAGLTRNISLLRKAIETPGQLFIETVPKRGYRFAAPVSPVTPDDPREGNQPRAVASACVTPTSHAQAGSPPGHAPRRLAVAALSVAVLSLVGMSWWNTRAPARPEDAVRSMAVLPFRHLNPNAGDAHLGVGLADQLITRFANLSSIVVTPTSTVLQYSGQAPLAAARALDVDVVLDGTIQHSGQRFRVTAQLVDVGTGRALWAGSFDESSGELLAVGETVMDAVAGLLVPSLAREERARIARRSTRSTAAWEAYVKGRALMATRTVTDVEQALQAFDAATRADPAFALAHAGVAEARIIQGNYQYLWPRDVFPVAKAAATRAIEVDGSLAEAHAALGAIAWAYDWDWTTAGREFQRAIALNPNNTVVRQWHSGYLMALGRWDESLREIDRAIELDPRGFAPNSARSLLLYFTRRYQPAIDQAERTMALQGNLAMPALYASVSHYLLGQFEPGRAKLEQARSHVGDIPVVIGFTARYASASGRHDRAREIIRGLEQLRSRVYVDAIFIASPYVGAGDTDRAIQWLRQGMADRSIYVPYMAIDPSFESLHDDARFLDMVNVVGLGEALTRVGRELEKTKGRN